MVVSHAQTMRVFQTWADVVGLTEGDRYLVVNPFFHTFGYKAGIIACLLKGATIVPEPVFDVPAVLARISAERITVLPGPPTLYASILDGPDRSDLDLSSLRLAVTGAASVPVAPHRADARGADVPHRAHRVRAHRMHRHGQHVPPRRRRRHRGDDVRARHPGHRGRHRRSRRQPARGRRGGRGRACAATT